MDVAKIYVKKIGGEEPESENSGNPNLWKQI